MPSRTRALVFAFLVFAFQTCCALQPVVQHPLDGLTPDEYWKVYHVLSDAGKLAEKTQSGRSSSIRLRRLVPGSPFVVIQPASPSCS